MQLTILGCGGSLGIPMIGCECAVCTSSDPRNQRTRTAALLRSATTTILIDAGPDVRYQMLRAQVKQLDAVVITHHHQDHIGGVDDLRPFCWHTPLPVYTQAATIERLRSQYAYAFDPGDSPSTRPKLELHAIDTQPFSVGDITLTPLPIWHGDWDIRGFRCGACAYITDVSSIPESTYALLHDLDTLILGALRYTQPHPMHMLVDEAVAVVERIGPRRAYFVHMAHDLDYAATNAALPEHIQLSYDGLTLECA